ncbi:putative Integral membrane protein [Seiridium cardinale]|uniref:Integral membrane protein n=1 Tax=Seiridium cardinale TaxID=138064 RepID=A0ABR2XNV0_9PEZI
MGIWDRENYGTIAEKTCWLMFSFITVIISLRIYCRLHYSAEGLIRGLGVDDIITVLCWALFLATCIIVSVGASRGMGKHVDVLLAQRQLTEALKWSVITSSVSLWVFSLPKCALVALLKRILNYGAKTTTLFWGLVLTSQACVLATSISCYLRCSPIESGWNHAIKSTCVDANIMLVLGYFTSSYSALLDIFFALYPIPLIMRLNMRLRDRVTISILLGLNALACVVSVYKIIMYNDILSMTAQDPSFAIAYLNILGVSEGFILLICASLSTLCPLFRSTQAKIKLPKGAGSGPNQLQQPVMDSHSSSGEDIWRGNRHPNSDVGSIQQDSPRVGLDEIPLVVSPQHAMGIPESAV